MCFQQITDIDATVYYRTTIFKAAEIKNNTQVLAATVAVGFTKTMLNLSRAATVGGTFLVFSVISARSAAFVDAHVPEAKGRSGESSLEQIEMWFQNENGMNNQFSMNISGKEAEPEQLDTETFLQWCASHKWQDKVYFSFAIRH
ncbi:hypothetical protein SADUNF_Sadunf11G0028200 [Salix dunnii]|uniref:Uncharacterized protein n=1 Tax=Salix dunnii TaxID=1413687 RepID=A0A835JMU1_9ROSI|nr:hypothetical protein SADUNF_Sadunf11G0028200 [Salix dunnii]